MQAVLDLSICIVNYSAQESLDECLHSIADNKGDVRIEVFVVDNASSDCSADMVSSHHPWVNLIANPRNVGFAAANNQALRLAKGRHVLILNPDTVVTDNALRTMVDFMDKHPEAGAVACRLVKPDGEPADSVRMFPDFRIALRDFTIVGLADAFSREYRAYKMRGFDHKTLAEVDQVTGAAMMVRRDVIKKIGFFDPDFFLFYEDVDICWRLQQCGYKNYFLPSATMTHDGGRSMAKAKFNLSRVKVQSLLRFLEKREGPRRTPVFKLFFKPLFVMNLPLGLFWGSLRLIGRLVRRQDASRIHQSLKNLRGALGMLGWKNLTEFLFFD